MMSWDMRPTAVITGDDAGDMRPTAMIASDTVCGGAGDQRRSCFCCGEVGHLARDCLQRVSRKSPGAALTCFACGQPGHFARDCPNKFMRNRPRNRPSRPNRPAGITPAVGTSAGGSEGGLHSTAGVTRAGVMRSSDGGPNHTVGITGATGTVEGEGGPNRIAGITRAAGTSAIVGEGGPNRTNPFGGEGRPNRAAGITQAAGTSAVRVGGEGRPNRAAGITQAAGTSAVRVGGEGGPNRTAGITRAGGTNADGGEDGPNHTAGIIRPGYMSAARGEGGPNCTIRITQAGCMSGFRVEGGLGITRADYNSAGGRREGGPNHTTRITRAGSMGTDGGEGGPIQAGGTGAGRGKGAPNRAAGIIRAGGTGPGRGEGGPNHTARITPAGGTGVDGGEDGPNHTTGITRARGTGLGEGEGGPNHPTGITRACGTGTFGRGFWIRRRELPHTVLLATADQSKDSTFEHGSGIGGVSSSNQTGYFAGTLSREYGGSGYLPNEPVSQSYHNVNWKYDTGKSFGSSSIAGGGSSSREYSNLLDISKGDCRDGSSGSLEDSGEACSASEGKIMEKRCGFVAKVSEGIDGERLSNGNYTSGKSFNNNGTTSRDPAVIEISSSSSEDEEEEGIVRKKTTGFLFLTGKVKEEIKRVVGDDADDDDADDDCVILECNPFEPPTTDFEQKVSLADHKSSIVHDEDITVISERGQVACRDYPHSRHHCAKFPFSKTTHESCCPQCYCYICEEVAPCEYWDGSCGHCHASDLDPIWGIMKKIYKNL